MGSIDYKDFELCIEKRGGQRYHAKVLRSLCGEPDIDFKLPFSKLELENFILKIGSARRGIRRINTPEMQTAREFGTKLFESIFSGDVRSCLLSSQFQAMKEGHGLRLKLRLEAPELINIPWEFLYDKSHARFLALFEKTPIVRYIDVLDQIEPLKVELPLSMLVMISSPEDYPSLDNAREKDNLKNATKELISNGLINITWMDQATLPALADQLMRGQYHIFHFIGHGGFDEKNQDGILVMEDEIQRGYFVSGERLAVLLGNQSSLRMVVLNSCEGGRTSSTDPFAGVATTLVRTGSVSAVVAMQLAITDQAAITFARGLYNALSLGRPVDAAVTQARLAIFADNNDVEWGTPVLYMRSPDGLIFDTVDRKTPQSPVDEVGGKENHPEMLTELYEKAVNRLDKEEWSSAHDLLLQIRKIQPGYRDVADLLSRAENEQKRLERKTELLKQGKESMGQREWPQAVLAFQQALSISPDDSEIQKMLTEAKVEKSKTEQVSTYLAQGKTSLKQKEWSRASEVLNQALELAPDCAEAKSLLTEAQAELESPPAPSSPVIPARPTSLPEEIRLNRRPKDLPK